MSTRVFISYRRDDSAYAARGVHDRLEREFGRESLFMDVDAIPLGADFVEVLGAEVAKCDVLLAIIGPDWLEARDGEGNRRLESEHDFVRIEIAAALKRNIPVIPILLEGTRMPKAEQMPDNLEGLARRNGLDVRHASFHDDLDRLVRALRGTTRPSGPSPTDQPICPPEPTSTGEALTPPVIQDDDRPAEMPEPVGSSEPVTLAVLPADDRCAGPPKHASVGEVKREPKAKVPRPVRVGAVLGTGLVLAATVLWVFFYVDRMRKPGVPEFTDCADVCPAMIIVPAGKFIMGAPKNERSRFSDQGPQREVTIAAPFAVSKFEVTFAEWDACVAATACRQVEDEWGRGKMPVTNVSWNDAEQYVRWLSQSTGKAYRLLTEAEWEYAARAGTTTRYSWGDDIGKGNANCAVCGSRWDFRQTAPVGQFKPNAFGLYDTHGNVWELVEDSWHDNYDGAPRDGSAWLQGGDARNRVIRGGSWRDVPLFLGVTLRGRSAPDDRNSTEGFRVARTLTP